MRKKSCLGGAELRSPNGIGNRTITEIEMRKRAIWSGVESGGHRTRKVLESRTMGKGTELDLAEGRCRCWG